MKLNSTALIRSVIAVFWLIVGMTIAAEQLPQFKALLAQYAGHHWVGKGIIAAVAFIVLYLLQRKSQESNNILGGVLLVVGSAVLGGAAIFLFFLWHFVSA